ncbi:MAG: amidohydrolase [Planctomycetota bacterium]
MPDRIPCGTMTLHLRNARIWTGDPDRPWASSLTIRQGRVATLDGDPEADLVIDGGGRTAAPGLVDAHIHLLVGGETLGELDLSHVRSRGEFEAAIAKRHEELPPGRWLIAGGWSQENWPGGQMPDKTWLAAAGGAEGRPVVCHRMDLHAVLVNEPVLALCDTAVEPAAGRIEREPGSGEPTGLLVETAAWELINPVVPKPDAAERRQALLAAQRHLHGFGVTAVGTMEYERSVREVYAPLREQLSLRCRVILLDRGWPMDFDFGRSFPGDNRLAVIGYKTFTDGTLGSRSARMLADYADDPGHRGELLELAAAGHLGDWARAVAAAGLAPVMHAIGDEAVRAVLGVIEDLPAGSPRPRVEHAQHIDEADFPRFRGVIASMQPLHKADDCRYVQRRLGPERLAGAFAFRRLLDAGALLAFGSDWPVVSCDPMLGLRAAITGLTHDGEVFAADQNLTSDEALRAYTAGSAGAVGLAGGGVLRPGGLGDVVLFDRDPFEANWVDQPPRVIMTIVGGEIAYDAT